MAVDDMVERYLGLIEKDTSKVLGLKFGDKVLEPGQYVSRSEATLAPSISFAVPDRAGTYMAMCIDLDGPFPSFNFLSPILHWIQPGFRSSPSDRAALTTEEPFVADYVGPGPPPGSSPHRYVVLLYEQPDGFDGQQHAPPNGQSYGNMARMRFSLNGWEKKAGLASPVAVNYFLSN